MFSPWLAWEFPSADSRVVRVCDFASAGAKGTRYCSWLPVAKPPPPPVVTRHPADGAVIPPGRTLFRWTGPKRAGEHVDAYQLSVFPVEDPGAAVIHLTALKENRVIVDEAVIGRLIPGKRYAWRVVAQNSIAVTESVVPDARFMVDASLPPLTREASFASAPEGLLCSAALAGKPDADIGVLRSAAGIQSAPGVLGQPETAVETDGKQGRVIFGVPAFPDEDYTLALWVHVLQAPPGRLGQICSAWTAPMDDPLRICVEGGKLFARIEAGQGYSTGGVAFEANRWHHVAVVKTGTDLRLYLNGAVRGQTTVPLFIRSQAQDIALGGNPHYSGDEFLAARFARLVFYERALRSEELERLADARSLTGAR